MAAQLEETEVTFAGGALTIAVTVTYGERWCLLRQAVRSLLANEVASVIVVNNSGSGTVANRAQREFGCKVSVITLGANTGSANGYKVGIEAAIAGGAEFIFLLDDDNIVLDHCLQTLRCAFHRKLGCGASLESLSVLAFRPDHQAGITRGDSVDRLIAHPNSFFGFHVKDLAYKVWSRVLRQAHRKQRIPDLVSMAVAPYSGMYFHRSLVEKFGTPDPRLVLYADDTEFSYRITSSGGCILLVSKARVEDLEKSWNVASRGTSAITVWLTGRSDLRAYYAARNQAWFERYRRPHSRAVKAVNGCLYLLMMGLASLWLRRAGRFLLILAAVRDGRAERLGPNSAFPL